MDSCRKLRCILTHVSSLKSPSSSLLALQSSVSQRPFTSLNRDKDGTRRITWCKREVEDKQFEPNVPIIIIKDTRHQQQTQITDFTNNSSRQFHIISNTDICFAFIILYLNYEGLVQRKRATLNKTKISLQAPLFILKHDSIHWESFSNTSVQVTVIFSNAITK